MALQVSKSMIGSSWLAVGRCPRKCFRPGSLSLQIYIYIHTHFIQMVAATFRIGQLMDSTDFFPVYACCMLLLCSNANGNNCIYPIWKKKKLHSDPISAPKKCWKWKRKKSATYTMWFLKTCLEKKHLCLEIYGCKGTLSENTHSRCTYSIIKCWNTFF